MPKRRCVGCGRIGPKPELMRLVAVRRDPSGPAIAMQDPDATMPGRGAYLCRGEDPGRVNPECLARARRRGGVARTLRSPVTVAAERLESVSR